MRFVFVTFSLLSTHQMLAVVVNPERCSRRVPAPGPTARAHDATCSFSFTEPPRTTPTSNAIHPRGVKIRATSTKVVSRQRLQSPDVAPHIPSRYPTGRPPRLLFDVARSNYPPRLRRELKPSGDTPDFRGRGGFLDFLIGFIATGLLKNPRRSGTAIFSIGRALAPPQMPMSSHARANRSTTSSTKDLRYTTTSRWIRSRSTG